MVQKGLNPYNPAHATEGQMACSRGCVVCVLCAGRTPPVATSFHAYDVPRSLHGRLESRR